MARKEKELKLKALKSDAFISESSFLDVSWPHGDVGGAGTYVCKLTSAPPSKPKLEKKLYMQEFF